MQKKLIALAVASLVSGAAFAQVAPNNVTMSGIIDMGYQYSTDSLGDSPSQHAFNDGGQDGSRLKLDGTEDLGNGLKVGFHTDFRFSVDKRSWNDIDNNNLFLTGGFGTITAGSFGTAPDDINGYSEVTGGMSYANSVLDMLKESGSLKNAVKYNSPNFGGLDFMVGVSTNNQMAAEVEPNSDANVGNQQAITARVSYINGPIKAGVAVLRDKMQNAEDTDRRTEWLLSGSYNFGPVMLGAGYSRTSYTEGSLSDADAAGVGETAAVAPILNPITGALVTAGVAAGPDLGLKRRTAYRINVGAPIGANDAVALSFSRTNQKYFGDYDSDKATGWGLSYIHTLSKRSHVYAAYGKVNQDNDNNVMAGANGSYEQSFKVGLRHQF